jgi:hypothetical protein
LVSDFGGKELAGERLDGDEEFSTELVADMSPDGTTAAGLAGLSSGGRGRGSGSDDALRG